MILKTTSNKIQSVKGYLCPMSNVPIDKFYQGQTYILKWRLLISPNQTNLRN